jgi:hypothetical protein
VGLGRDKFWHYYYKKKKKEKKKAQKLLLFCGDGKTGSAKQAALLNLN